MQLILAESGANVIYGVEILGGFCVEAQ